MSLTRMLLARAEKITINTGRPPKRLSISVHKCPELLREVHPGTIITSNGKRGLRFAGFPLRVRNYRYERQRKWHGAGAPY